MASHENHSAMVLCHCDHIASQFSRMDFKHKSPVSQNGNYMEHTHHRSPYNQDSMLHHINASPKEHYQQHHQTNNVYEYSNGIQYNNKYQQNVLAKNHYQHRSPVSHRLRRRCRSECLSPSGSPQYQYEQQQQQQRQSNGRNSHLSNNGYQNNYSVHEQDLWRMQRRSEERDFDDHHYQQRQTPRHEFLGVDGYKFKFNNLQIDGKSVGIHSEDISDETDYETWSQQQRRRIRARSESAAFQDYYFHEACLSNDTQDVKRTHETLLKEKKATRTPHSLHLNNHPTAHHVTNNIPKANFSVLVNNTNHYRYSPKSRIRSHHVGNKIRVSSPLHKARLQMWKNQNSGSSSILSTESNTPTPSSRSQALNSKACDDDEDEFDDDSDDEDDEEPPILTGSEVLDDDMTDPEDNYESSLSLSSSDISSSLAMKTMMNIHTECVLSTGRVTQQPLAPSLFPFVPPYISFATYEEKGPDMPAMIHKILKWKLTTITPLLVRKVLLNTGFRLMKSPDDHKMAETKFKSLSEPNDWVGTWGKHMKSPCFKTLHSYQKFNHLPGSFQIGRKDRCWRNLQTLMRRHGKKEFGFMPRTFIIPQDLNMLRQTWHKYSQKNTKWIIKPPASARGTGIRVVNSWSQIPKRKPLIVQRYIERPLLINGSKFDLRLYVLVTSMNPLRCYMHTDGLARFASVKYSERTETLNDRYMHLTNYSINKLSTNYDKNDDANACKGMKWTIKSLWSYLQKKGINTERLWGALRNLVLRTVLAGEGPINGMIKSNLQNKYNSFELFGIDVLLDSELIPWLLEVNISPSLHSASNLDMAVKGPLVTALLNTAMYQIPPKISVSNQSELSRELNVNMPLVYDKRIYVTTLSKDERQKHQQFTQKIMLREEYVSAILENLTPDDIRCLILTEDELNRCHPLERIFPAPNSYKYLQFTEQARYYNLLLDAWENRYGKKREAGVAILRVLCWKRYHLKVPPSSIQKDCDDKELEKITEEPMQTSTNEARPTESDRAPVAMESNEIQEETKQTINSTVEELIEVDSNENKDTSNLASEILAASPKKSHQGIELGDGKFYNSSIIPCLDSEILLVKQ